MRDAPSSPNTPRSGPRARALRGSSLLGLFSLRWILTGACVVCIALWALNLWAWIDLDAHLVSLHSSHGILRLEWHDWNRPPDDRDVITWTTLSELPGYELEHRLRYFVWFPHWGSFGSGSAFGTLWYADLPLWMPFLALGLASFVVWRRHRRQQARAAVGACLTCGYDLAGLEPGSSCPECGQ